MSSALYSSTAASSFRRPHQNVLPSSLFLMLLVFYTVHVVSFQGLLFEMMIEKALWGFCIYIMCLPSNSLRMLTSLQSFLWPARPLHLLLRHTSCYSDSLSSLSPGGIITWRDSLRSDSDSLSPPGQTDSVREQMTLPWLRSSRYPCNTEHWHITDNTRFVPSSQSIGLIGSVHFLNVWK